MKKMLLLFMFSSASLIGCGGSTDNPDTIPVHGKWIESVKVQSLSVNGVYIDISNSEQFTEIINKYNDSSDICGEPMDLNERQFQEKMGTDKFANCSIDSRKVNGNRISETASCDAVNLPGVTDRVRFVSVTKLEPDKVVSDVAVNISGQNPSTGARAILKLEMQGTTTRIGDC